MAGFVEHQTDHRRPRLLAAIALASLALSGCARYRAEPLAPQREAADFSARRLDDPGLSAYLAALRAAPAGSIAWNLGRLSLAALYFHPDLLVARAQLAAATAAIRTAAQRPNPTLTILGGTQPQLIGYSLSLLFETFSKRGYRITQARDLAIAAQANLIDAAWKIRANVRAALLDCWAAQRRLALARSSLSVQRQLVALQQQRLAQGAASATDIALERIALARLDLATGDLMRARDQSRVALAIAIGIPAEALDRVPLDLFAFDDPPTFAETDLATLRLRALTQRADTRSLLADYDAAQAALHEEIARQYPDLVLSPAYNYDFRNQFEINPTLALPIFNRNEGPIAEAEARRQEAAARYLAAQSRIAGEVEQAQAGYAADTASLAAADRVLGDEAARLRATNAALRAGAIDRPTQVTARAEAATINAARFEVVLRQRQDLGAIEDAMQQTLFDPGTRFPLPDLAAKPAGPRPGARPQAMQ